MRIIRFADTSGAVRWGLDLGDGRAQPMTGCIYGDHSEDGGPVAVGRLLAPVVPSNILCIGLNYRQHAIESGNAIPSEPVVFMKPTTTVISPGDPILVPDSARKTGEVDYECELAVIIGKKTKRVSVSAALGSVFGYTVANDVSARHWQQQRNAGQWTMGKSFDTFCPLGPAIVTADEIPDPQDLMVRTVVNGRVLQEKSTDDMIFTVAQIISFLSHDITLLPGTVILTGTPEGVGSARKPPVWLMPGDTVTVEVESIGKLTNPVSQG